MAQNFAYFILITSFIISMTSDVVVKKYRSAELTLFVVTIATLIQLYWFPGPYLTFSHDMGWLYLGMAIPLSIFIVAFSLIQIYLYKKGK